MDLKQLLAKTNASRDKVIKNDGRLTVDGRPCRVGVGAQIARVAHEEEGRKVAQHKAEATQSAADADILLHFFVAAWAKGGEILEAIGLLPCRFEG